MAYTPGCRWGRRSHAVPLWAWWRRIRPASPNPGTGCWGGWRESAPRWSRSARARPSSRSRACGGSTAAMSTGVVAAARSAAGVPVRIAVAPGRFAAIVAAGQGDRFPRLAQPGGEAVISPRALRKFLAPLPVSTLARRLAAPEPEEDALIARPEAARARHARQARGALSRPARRSLRGDRPAGAAPRPRRGHAAAPARAARGAGRARSSCRRGPPGAQLDRALELLVDRLLAAPGRRGRTVLALRLSAPLAAAGAGASSRGWAARPPRRGYSPRSCFRKLEALPGAGDGAAAAGAGPRPAGSATSSSSRSAGSGRAARASRRRCGRSAPRRARRRCSR